MHAVPESTYMKPVGDRPEESKPVAEGNAEFEKRSEREKHHLRLSDDLERCDGDECRDVSAEIERSGRSEK